jgi:hypothetical protein
MAEQKQTPGQQLYYIGIAAIVVIVLIALWLLFARDKPESQPVNLLPPELTVPQAVEPEPAITQPEAEPEVTAAEPDAPEIAEPVAVAEPPIPPLDESDSDVKQRLLTLDWQPGLAGLFITENMLRNFAVQTDNIAQGQLVKGFHLLQPLEQKFSLPEGAPMLLDEASFKRYQPYIQLLQSVPAAQMVKLFNRYEPLLQQAYAEQGYPDELFKNKLIAAIDVLLATPEVRYPLALRRPSVVYEFADPELEQLPAAQKQMLRLGPDNQKKIKALLKQYRQLLTQQ